MTPPVRYTCGDLGTAPTRYACGDPSAVASRFTCADTGAPPERTTFLYLWSTTALEFSSDLASLPWFSEG